MTFSAALAMASRLVIQCEGTKLAPYQDSGGVYTIGNGTISIDGEPVTAETPPITMARASELMMAELLEKAAAVNAVAPADATDGQRASCYSFTYNEGVSAFQKSTLLKKWLVGDVLGAASQFDQWIYAGGRVVQGLVNRRKLEKAIFLGLTTV